MKRIFVKLKKHLIGLLILVGGTVLIINLSQDIWGLLRASDQVALVEKKVAELKKERQLLLEKKEYYQSAEFVEEEARNRLNMTREGEIVVILPPNVRQLAGQVESEFAGQEAVPNWKRWWKLFF